METILIPVEKEIKQWMKEAMKEYFEETTSSHSTAMDGSEPLVSRKEIAQFLDISLVTLHDWMKRGLPSHKQRGRVYFMRSEVLEYIESGISYEMTGGGCFYPVYVPYKQSMKS